MRRSRRVPLVAVLACTATLLAGCTDDSPTAAPPASPTAEAAEHARTLQIYTAVIRQLITKDNAYGGGPGNPYKRVSVVDAAEVIGPAVVAGGNFTSPRRFDEPFSPALRKDLRTALAELGPLRFVSVAAAAADLSSERLVRGRGAVVTVGRIVEAGSQVQVSHELRCGPKCGQFMTYVLERRGDAWVVTGTTGVSTIS